MRPDRSRKTVRHAMPLDLSSLSLLVTLVAALLGAMLLYFGRQERMAALYWWGGAYLLGAVAIAIWTFLTPVFGTTAWGAAGSVGIVACSLIWNAARVFHGRRPTWSATAVAIVTWIAAAAMLPGSSTESRLVVCAALVVLFAGLASGELWSERRRSLQRRWLALALPLLHGGVLLLPILAGAGLAGDAALGRMASLFAIELVLYAIGTVFVIVMMVSERSVSVHRMAAQTDPLTGIMNRRGFSDAATAMIARQTQLGRPVSLLVFDVDRFKSINDRFGHPAGDEVLKMFATIVAQTLRTTDLSGRLGGEEFAALLPCATEDAAIAAERVRVAFATSDIAIDDATVETTVSIGIAGGTNIDLPTLLVAADAALYRAKSDGRNRVVLAGAILPTDASTPAAQKPNVVRRAPAVEQLPV